MFYLPLWLLKLRIPSMPMKNMTKICTENVSQRKM